MSVTVILGRRGCGKTTNIKARLHSESRLIIFDTLAEYGACGRVFRDPLAMVDYLERRQRTYFKCVYQPVEAEDLTEPFSYVMRAVWICGDCTLVLDEIDQVSSPSSVPFELRRNLNYGRHRSIKVILSSRRAANVPRLVTSQADEIVSFNQIEPRDVKYIEEFCGSEFAERTKRLPKYQCITFRPGQDHREPMNRNVEEEEEREEVDPSEREEKDPATPLTPPSDSGTEEVDAPPPGN